MPGRRSSRRARGVLVITLVTLVLGILPVIPASAASPGPRIPVIPAGSAYRQRNLVSDIPGMALLLDPLMVDPWGISKSASSPFWVANDGTSTSQILTGDVSGSPLVLNAAPQTVTIPGGLPTGTVFNATSDFNVTPPGGVAAPARFIFDSITGNIAAWQSALGTRAQIVASHPGHVYTGLAIGNNGAANFLYAADFANGTIDVFDSAYALQPAASFPFVDPTIPTTAGNVYHPYNIQNIGGSLYVTYAKENTSTGRSEAGVGNGFVRRFNFNGVRDLTFGINNGPLNAPWGATIAPASFGIFGGALLIGNFGEGNPSIHAFNPTTGAFLGTIQDEGGDGIVIDELWALSFGNGGAGGSPNTLYFTAGTGEEEHGLFGSLQPTTAVATSTVQFATDEYAIGEGGGSISITATRNGDASAAASVRYNTWDMSQVDHASQKSDYEINAGVLNFAPGETSKTFTIRIVDDNFDENDETVNLALSNPTGLGVGLGSQNQATLKIVDNDSTPPITNPIDQTAFFIRQNYIDFFGHEPSAASLTYWSNYINACGANASCRRTRRNTFGVAVLLSKESNDSLGLIYRVQRAAFRDDPLYGDAMLGAQVKRSLGTGAMLNLVMSSPRFVSIYNSLSNAQYVNTLVANSKFAFPAATKNTWINRLNNGTMTRATVLLQLSQNLGYQALVRRRWIVLMGFWGFLRRDPDLATFRNRLNALWAAHGNAAVAVDAFINPTGTPPHSEYRQRFGPE
jgi:uncharacterized protein (TIGR03118 family)